MGRRGSEAKLSESGREAKMDEKELRKTMLQNAEFKF